MGHFQDLTAEEARIVDEAVRIIQSRMAKRLNGGSEFDQTSFAVGIRRDWKTHHYFDRNGDLFEQPESSLSDFFNLCMAHERGLVILTPEQKRENEVEKLKARLAELEA